MCGIFGYIKSDDTSEATTSCLDGLKLLEYRGYDSSGIAGFKKGKIHSIKTTGKIQNLEDKIEKAKFPIIELNAAIGHTRWATHGKLSDVNAHPHMDHQEKIALVHNGIIENYLELKSFLTKQQQTFLSDTDTEVIAQLISHYYQGSMIDAVVSSAQKLNGSFAFAFIHKSHPDTIVATANECPLVIAKDNQNNSTYLSSDIKALPQTVNTLYFLEKGEIALIKSEKLSFFSAQGKSIKKPSHKAFIDSNTITKHDYEHFMLKEIHEQPISISHGIAGRIIKNMPFFSELEDLPINKCQKITLLGCGTSYHAALLGKSFIEKYAKLPAEAHIASEYRYSSPYLSESEAVMAISQSGETADTIAALKKAHDHSLFSIGICNSKQSSLTRFVDSSLFIHAGPEISVCSTKAFTSQITVLALFSLALAHKRNVFNKDCQLLIQQLQLLPTYVKQVLALEPEIQKIAKEISKYKKLFFLGRQYMYPTAMESALKVKEISYINATAYPSGEMKHGPIALIDRESMTVGLCGHQGTLDKIISNLEEVYTRNGNITVFTCWEHPFFNSKKHQCLKLPYIGEVLTPVLFSIATQLLAYHIALASNTPIDQPRNLAKSVTVE